MKIRCEIDCKIFPIDDPGYKPFNVPIWMANSFENNCKFHVKYRMIIVRLGEKDEKLEILHFGHWWKKPARQEVISLFYAGVEFNYDQKTKKISIAQDIIII